MTWARRPSWRAGLLGTAALRLFHPSSSCWRPPLRSPPTWWPRPITEGRRSVRGGQVRWRACSAAPRRRPGGHLLAHARPRDPPLPGGGRRPALTTPLGIFDGEIVAYSEAEGAVSSLARCKSAWAARWSRQKLCRKCPLRAWSSTCSILTAKYCSMCLSAGAKSYWRLSSCQYPLVMAPTELTPVARPGRQAR